MPLAETGFVIMAHNFKARAALEKVLSIVYGKDGKMTVACVFLPFFMGK